MNNRAVPYEIVDLQLRAYNAHDIEAFCTLYADDAFLFNLNTGEPIARGIAALRAVYTGRFGDKKLRAEIRSRIEVGNFVIDHECIIGATGEERQVIAIYEVRDSLIHSVRFIWP